SSAWLQWPGDAFLLPPYPFIFPRSIPDGCAIQRYISRSKSLAGANESQDVDSAQYHLSPGSNSH
ncbi:hypothetical protein, partial [Aeromonas piscicola]|uniref:hypothetical protein n=1 Tax=Aeromonas piscicola TaxID=600645 RepID=UPI001AE055D5